MVGHVTSLQPLRVASAVTSPGSGPRIYGSRHPHAELGGALQRGTTMRGYVRGGARGGCSDFGMKGVRLRRMYDT
jgi:hypothetical protein